MKYKKFEINELLNNKDKEYAFKTWFTNFHHFGVCTG